MINSPVDRNKAIKIRTPREIGSLFSIQIFGPRHIINKNNCFLEVPIFSRSKNAPFTNWIVNNSKISILTENKMTGFYQGKNDQK